MLTLTNVYDKNYEAFISGKYRYIVNQGGTSSSKTYSILQLLTALALLHPFYIEIVGLTVPHLKSGVLHDIPSVFEQFGLNWYELYNQTDKYVQFESGGRLQFTAFDNIGKAHGGRRDILFLNEANHLAYPIVEQLTIRTKKAVFIDYNPTNAFWFHNKIQLEKPNECILIKSTYKDNQYLSDNIIAELESKKGDGNNNFWRVYGLGELGVAEGLVFENVNTRAITDEEISRFDIVYQGIDWGYIHPFSFTKCCYDDEAKRLYIFDEIYQSRLSLQKSMELVREKQEAYGEIIADSANPQSIGDFWDNGFNIYPANKTPGSRDFGYRWLQSLNEIVIDPIRCPNTADEFMTMEYLKDKDGNYINDYPKVHDDAIDSIRYALERVMPYGIK